MRSGGIKAFKGFKNINYRIILSLFKMRAS